MKIEIELPNKLEEPLDEVVNSLKEANEGKELTAEAILSQVCKQYVVSEFSKLLMNEDVK